MVVQRSCGPGPRLTYRDVGLELGISRRTVEEHLKNIKRSLGAASGSELIIRAIEQGYLLLGPRIPEAGDPVVVTFPIGERPI